jgi:hypothetical protein
MYNADNGLFYFVGDSDGFGPRVSAFTPGTVPPPSGTTSFASSPTMNLYLNTDLYGLLSNFNSTYFNSQFPWAGGSPFYPTPTYAYRINFVQQPLFSNVIDLTVYPSANAGGYVPASQSKYWYIMEQDFSSTSDLWSPIQSVVFTSSQIPTQFELECAPQQLGQGQNISSSSQFSQVITDTALDLSQTGAQGYKQYFFYAPEAEYRLTDINASLLKDVDLQVFWKCRMNGQLYPIQLYNNASCGVKILFRKKSVFGKAQDR